MWPRCSTVQEAFDRYNSTFEAAITDALLLMRAKNEQWATLNSFGWAFGASCETCSGSASGCMINRLEQLGLLGDEDPVSLEHNNDDDINNMFRSSQFYNTPTGDAEDLLPSESVGGTTSAMGLATAPSTLASVGTSTSTKSLNLVQTKKSGSNQKQPMGSNWRSQHSYRTMRVTVGLRCHIGDDNLCSSFTSQIFQDQSQMESLKNHVLHNLESSLQVYNAQIIGITATPKGGSATLTWTVGQDSVVRELFAIVESSHNRVKIVDSLGVSVAYVKFHQSIVGSTTTQQAALGGTTAVVATEQTAE